MKKFIGVTVLLCCLIPWSVSANDGIAAEGVGGVTIAKTNKIALETEVLDISCDRIHVSYAFVNESDQDEDALLMFPLPAYTASIPLSDTYAGQPADFTITAGGKTVSYQTQVKAVVVEDKWVGGRRKILREVDVTDKLKTAGLSEKDIANFPMNTNYVQEKLGQEGYYQYPLSNEQIRKLVKARLMAEGEMGETTPVWENRVTYIWSQRFPAKTVVHVEHSYRPFTSGGASGGYSADTNSDNFCLSKENISWLKSLLKNKKNLDGYGNVPGTEVQYILTTANSWKDGIRDFTLRLHPKSKEEVISACVPATLVRKADNLYEAHIRNFHPTKELTVYFGNARNCNSDNSGISPTFQ